MYQKYTTEGFIVSQRHSKESDVLYHFYTKEFGMIFATATSVRSSKSKLRGKLVIGSKLHITIIKSKTSWRLVEVENSGEYLLPKSDEYKKFCRILIVLKSLIHGEEKSESLFDVLNGLYNLLLNHGEDINIDGPEFLAMLKILHILGYGGGIYTSKYSDKEFDINVFNSILSDREDVIKEINKSLKITGF